MKLKIEEILDKTIEEIRQGKDIEDVLEKYPEFAEELKTLLLIAKDMEKVPKPMPSDDAIKKTIYQARTLYEKEQKVWSFKKLFIFQPAFVRALAIVIFIILIISSGLSFSARTIPGDALYPIKRFSERVYYGLVLSRDGKVKLRIRFADRRAEELVYTFNKNKRIDEKLLNSMLDETENAYKLTESLSEEKAFKLFKKIAEINNAQMDILKNIKQDACACDTNLINQALDVCHRRCQCLENRLKQKDKILPCPDCGDSCTCW